MFYLFKFFFNIDRSILSFSAPIVKKNLKFSLYSKQTSITYLRQSSPIQQQEKKKRVINESFDLMKTIILSLYVCSISLISNRIEKKRKREKIYKHK